MSSSGEPSYASAARTGEFAIDLVRELGMNAFAANGVAVTLPNPMRLEALFVQVEPAQIRGEGSGCFSHYGHRPARRILPDDEGRRLSASASAPSQTNRSSWPFHLEHTRAHAAQ
jgi:hypothetical protein